MKTALNDASLDLLFRDARSYNRWLPQTVPEATLRALYDLLKLGPTSVNCSPARFLFVTSAEARAILVGCVTPGNVVKVEQAPVTVIIGMDEIAERSEDVGDGHARGAEGVDRPEEE